ncbi:MAG: aminomethyl-transferring glycine dehydrogenase subunit GcvPA [Chloroflexota bacterium]
MAFVPLTADERQAMLDAVGVASVADLFADIPADVRFPHLDVPPPLTEIETVAKMSALAAKNQHVGQLACFVGAGYYNHYSPSVVSHLMGRSEFYTSYTPYQPEVSQGTLQYSFEFQSLVCDLFEMDVANSSVYDGASAAAEAVLMALRISRRDRVVLDGSVHPEYRAVVAAYLDGRGIDMVTSEVGLGDGTLARQPAVDLVDDKTACVVVQQPDFFGTIRDLAALAAKCQETGALLVYVVGDPVSLGLLKTPGSWGADIAVGEGQGLGLPLQYGGPGVGLMTCKQQHLRQLPGRIVGQTTDHDGRRGFVLTLQAREQHIRREKATSNICTSQTLLALGATIYLSTMGPAGLRQAAGLSHKLTRAVAERIGGLGGYTVLNDGPFFDEIAVLCPSDAQNTRHELAKRGIIGGYALGRDYPGMERGLVLCATERTTAAEIDKLIAALAEIGGGR